MVAAVLALVACAGHRGSSPSAAPLGADASARRQVVGAGPAGVQALAPQIVRRGRMGVGVDKLADAQSRLERTVASLAGHVAHLEVHESSRADYSLRVPAERLDALMDATAGLGKVESRTVSAEEVTEEVIDTEARLGALRASRDRLRQLLERASSVQDVVAVERELARVQGEVESLEARLTALRSQVAQSDLAVSLHQRPVLGPLGLLVTGLATAVGKLFIWR